MATKSLRVRLAEAEDALHALMCGTAATVYVDQSGERVEYAKANAAQLRSYIMSLQSQLGITPGGGTGFGTPLTVRF